MFHKIRKQRIQNSNHPSSAPSSMVIQMDGATSSIGNLSFKKIKKNYKDKYITMMVTATKVKALHIPYPTPAPTHTHTGTCPPPLYLT